MVPFNIYFTQWCIGEKKCRLHEVEGSVLGLDLFYLQVYMCVTRIKLRCQTPQQAPLATVPPSQPLTSALKRGVLHWTW